MNNILSTILKTKVDEVAHARSLLSISALIDLISQDPYKPRDFYGKIRQTIDADKVAVIAEVKQASPSKGVIRANFNPLEIAKSYLQNGATCLSVLTDGVYFRGDLMHLEVISKNVDLPALRKDFIIDEYQIYQSIYYHADAILLIVAALDEEKIFDLASLANSLSLSVLVEVHNLAELQIAMKIAKKTKILIGVNNRNLQDFSVDINTTINLQKEINNKYLICESGIKKTEDINKIRAAGVNGFLVGESFLVEHDPGEAMKKLFY